MLKNIITLLYYLAYDINSILAAIYVNKQVSEILLKPIYACIPRSLLQLKNQYPTDVFHFLVARERSANTHHHVDEQSSDGWPWFISSMWWTSFFSSLKHKYSRALEDANTELIVDRWWFLTTCTPSSPLEVHLYFVRKDRMFPVLYPCMPSNGV